MATIGAHSRAYSSCCACSFVIVTNIIIIIIGLLLLLLKRITQTFKLVQLMLIVAQTNLLCRFFRCQVSVKLRQSLALSISLSIQ